MWPFNKQISKLCYLIVIVCLVVIVITILGVISIFVFQSDKTRKNVWGELAKDDEFPYHVSVQFNKKHHCSGSLITRKHVLTAAHCVDIADTTPRPTIRVVVGTTKVPGCTVHPVTKITLHPSYTAKLIHMSPCEDKHPDYPRPNVTYDTIEFLDKMNDIAVVHLKKAATLCKSVRIIALPKPEKKLVDNQILLVTFFGLDRQSPDQDLSIAELTKFNVSVAPKARCENNYPRQNHTGKFCAWVYGAYSAVTTYGLTINDGVFDRGSPVILDNKYVIGIFSNFRSKHCGGRCDIFTYVPYYVDFIKSAIGRKS